MPWQPDAGHDTYQRAGPASAVPRFLSQYPNTDNTVTYRACIAQISACMGTFSDSPTRSREHALLRRHPVCHNVGPEKILRKNPRMRILDGHRHITKDVSLLLVAWCGLALIVNPLGDFPLLDDWAFGRTVAHLLSTGEYDALGWGWMTLVTNVVWGAAFSLPFGFSFTALRISTLVAAVIGLIGVYLLFMELQRSRKVAWLAVALIGLNPYLFSLSHSFMTDTPFTALMVWCSIYFIRSLRTRSDRQLIIATLLALAATLSRQLAICMPMAFAATYLLRSRPSVPTFARAFLPTAVCAIAYVIVLHFGLIGANVNTIVVQTLPDVQSLLMRVLNNVFFMSVHSGLLLIPILLAENVRQWSHNRARTIFFAIAAIAIVSLLVATRVHAGQPILLPHSLWLVPSGVGPVWLLDTSVLNIKNIQLLPPEFWVSVTIVALIGAVLLLTAFGLRITNLIGCIARRQTTGDAELVGIFSTLTAILYFTLLLPAPTLWDKYVAPMVPVMVIALIGLRQPQAPAWFDLPAPWRLTTWALIIVFGVYAVSGTRDYLAWNRVRWVALEELMTKQQVRPEDIDGGFEFNRLYLWDPTVKDADLKLWNRRGTRFVVASGSIPGYSVIKEYSYQHWLPWHMQKIVVLRRQD